MALTRLQQKGMKIHYKSPPSISNTDCILRCNRK